MVSVRIERVTKTFGDVRAVDDVSLRVESGELFFLLGPSGCGKTTLLRVLAGFYHPDTGKVFFGDRDVTLVPPHKRSTGMVFQNYALWPHMTVWQNVAFGLEMRKVAESELNDRVARALDRVQMVEYADRTPNQLSGGQQQRVALGRALVIEPDVVLLDEPLSNLDAKLRLEMREQIKRLHERLGLTMIYVTHDQTEALSMADRLAVMDAGRIAQIGSPREVYNRPESRFAADFIGETNLLRGTIAELGENVTIETVAGKVVADAAYNGAAVGDKVWCSIRPERLDVLTDDETRPNELEGTVARLVYLGNHEQYFVELSDGVEVKAVEYNVDHPKARTGETARIGCRAGNVVVLKA